MIFPLAAALFLTLVTFVLTAVVGLVLLLLRRITGRFWRRAALLHLGLFLLHLFVTFPALLGGFGSRMLGTRPQERAYAGPRLGADGKLLVQTWNSLAAE